MPPMPAMRHNGVARYLGPRAAANVTASIAAPRGDSVPADDDCPAPPRWNGVPSGDYPRIALGVSSLGGNRLAQLHLNPDDTVGRTKQELWETGAVTVLPGQQWLVCDQQPLRDECKWEELLHGSASQADSLEVTLVTADQVWSSSDSGSSVAISKDAVSAYALCKASPSSGKSHRAIGATEFSKGPFTVALRLQGKPGSMLTKLTRVGLRGSNGDTWSYDSSGTLEHNGKSVSYGPAYAMGDVIEVSYRDGHVSFALNGVDLPKSKLLPNVQLPLRAFADCTCTVAEWSFATPEGS